MSILIDALGPVLLCLGVVVGAAALYFIVTLIRSKVRRDEDDNIFDDSSNGTHMR